VIDMRMNDASRHFGSLPETYDPGVPQWDVLRDHVEKLAGAQLTGFVTDQVTEAWIDFAYTGHAFGINNQHGQWWFFVTDPACPDAVLERVLDHFEDCLAPVAARARRAGAVAAGSFRAVVLEPDARVVCRDFATRDAAQRHADDAASETEHGIVVAHVVDEDFRVVHTGRHYAAGKRGDA
jgi:hypothetical protein